MTDLVSLVNLLQGTASEMDYSTGNTLPIAARPFGMHHWTLQTAKTPWAFNSNHRKLWGIRLTHQPSPWMADYGSLLITAFHGPAYPELHHQSSAYTLTKGQPCALSVDLLRYGITCEMAPSERGAVFVFTARESEALKIRLHFEKEHSITASVDGTHFTGCSRDFTHAAPAGFGLHFYGEFDTAPETYSLLPDGGYWTFPKNVRRVEMRLAGSFIDEATARITHTRELKGKDLGDVCREGASIWNDLLGRIEIVAKSERHQRIFYSCLYRCLLFPRFLDEINANGKSVHYSPYDGKIHEGTLCTDNGFWDTHRTVYSLFAHVYPDKLKSILNGWLNACHQSGWTPKWPSPGLRDCMIGTHFDAVVADAVAKGITDWDVEAAFSYLWKDATVPSTNGAYGRQALEDYNRLGYVPADKHNYAVSSTLDYAYDDFCVAQVARYLGKNKEADGLLLQSKNYRNVFDPSVGFMRARNAGGDWAAFREFEWGGPFIEGGPWQHSFNVPHDPQGLAALFGGPTQLCAKLDAMLATPPRFEARHYGFEIHEMTEMALAGFGQYAHSNQPVHGFLFLYALMGQTEKTTHWVHRVAEELYTPDTFPGDEDNGEMAAWYVWATLGMFPHCPGIKDYVHFEPLAKSVTIHRPS